MEIHKKWKGLIRKIDSNSDSNSHLSSSFNSSHVCDQCASTAISLPFPFVIPGGRFREFYYWDSMWVLEGLYVSELCEMAENILKNIHYMIMKFDRVPNGSRTYYLNRSQPPLFTQMVYRHVHECKTNDTFLLNMLTAIKKEHEFWTRERTRRIEIHPSQNNNEKGNGNIGEFYQNINAKDANKYEIKIENNIQNNNEIENNFSFPCLFFYKADLEEPRPESYREDVQLAFNLPIDEKKNLYRNLGSAAESGWDFSGRWFSHSDSSFESSFNHSNSNTFNHSNLNLNSNPSSDTISNLKNNFDLKNLETTRFAPLDLNCVWAHNEALLAKMLKRVGKFAEAEKYESLSKSRSNLINLLFWSTEKRIYSDFDMKGGKVANRPVYISDLAPFWHLDNPRLDINLDLFASLLLNYPSGIPPSHQTTGHQWDFPNIWPPYQYLSIKGLENLSLFTNNSTLLEWNYSIAKRFLMTTWCGFQRYNGQIFEKYHASVIGIPGGGGEYIVQEGFGWTNGVLLWMMKKYPNMTLEDCSNFSFVMEKSKEKSLLKSVPKDNYNVEIEELIAGKSIDLLQWPELVTLTRMLVTILLFLICLLIVTIHFINILFPNDYYNERDEEDASE